MPLTQLGQSTADSVNFLLMISATKNMDHAFKVNKFNRFLNGIIWWFVLDLYHFPEMSHDDATLQMSPSNVSVASSERRRRQQKLNHDTEIIFVLPSLQMNFKTIHQQGVEEPRDGGTCQGAV